MRLLDFVQLYTSVRDVKQSYVVQLACCVRQLEKIVGRPVRVDQLDVDVIGHALRRWRQQGLADQTRQNRRRMLLTLWHDAADRQLVPPPHRRVAPVKVRQSIPKTWNYQQVQQFLRAAEGFPGLVSARRLPVRRSTYWSSYVCAAWDTGLRGCDLREMTAADILRHPQTGEAVVQLVQVKTGRVLYAHLQPATVKRIEKCLAEHPRERIWTLWGRVDQWRRQAARLVQLAGLPGSIGRLRHSSGSNVELLHPGQGHLHLGNTRKVFERHYFAPEVSRYHKPTPQPLEPVGPDGQDPPIIPFPGWRNQSG